jgi:AbrB family looped-hinge helix DNA binding protein
MALARCLIVPAISRKRRLEPKTEIAGVCHDFLDKVGSLITISAMITTVTGKNQITIPAKIAQEVGIQVGTRIDWSIGGDGVLIARLLPGRGTIARQVAGMGRAWLREGDDPVAELMQERSESATDTTTG